MLLTVTDQVFQLARSNLLDYSKKKCKLSISRWELLLILQMNTLDIKKIAQFVTGDNEPNEIDINNLFFLLVLTN